MKSIKYVINLRLFIVGLLLSGCGEFENSTDHGDANKTQGEFAVPSVIKSASLPPNATLIAKVYVDFTDRRSSPADTQKLVLPVTDGNIQFTLSGLPLGQHTFTIIFEYSGDPDFEGTFELARVTSDPVELVAGSNPEIILSELDYNTSADNDSDGVPNLTELGETIRTDPGKGLCVLGESKMGNCIVTI